MHLKRGDLRNVLLTSAGRELYDTLFVRPDTKPKETKASFSADSAVPKPNLRERITDTVSGLFGRPDYQPTLQDLLRYYRTVGVVGEERLCILQTLCAINRISFGVEGYSGSGKTRIVDSLVELLPDSEVYRVDLSSDLALFNDADKVNRRTFLYIPELQKAMGRGNSPIVEVIKNLTEGKDVTRVVTKAQGESIEYRITAGKCVIYTFALENRFKKDDESTRRFVKLTTNPTKEQVTRVLDHKAKERYLDTGGELSRSDLNNLRAHIRRCSNFHGAYIDPFSEYLKQLVPETSKSMGFVDHYFRLLDACANFHQGARTRDSSKLFLNLEDHFVIFSLYYDEFCASIRDLNSRVGMEAGFEIGPVDWKAYFESGLEVMAEHYPEQVDKWYESQRQDGSIVVTNCLTGNKEILVDH